LNFNNPVNSDYMKINKTVAWTTGILLSVAAMQSCDKGFDSVNKNPNSFTPDKVNPSFLLANTIMSSPLDPGMHERMTQLTNDIFIQYSANEGFSTQHGITNDEWITDFYNNYHNAFIASLNEAIRLGHQNPTPLNETQIARIWRCWIFSRATDLWGDIPYFKAADGTGTNPPYDPQALIYKDMLKELKEAVDSLSATNPKQIVGQDVIYNDNISKWKKFGNSLRLRLAMRLTNVEPALAKQNVEEAFTSGLIGNPSESCVVPRSLSYGWGNDYQYTYYYGWGSEGMSRSMENLLTGLGGQPFPNPPAGAIVDDPGISLTPGNENSLDPNANLFKRGIPSKVDPRGPIYFNVSSDESGAIPDAVINGQTVDTRNRWHGTPAGLSSTAAGKQEYQISNQARLGAKFSKDHERGYEIITYHEVCFLLAEAAQRGWSVGGTAQEWYVKGITESMKWQGIPDATITAYLASTDQNTYGTTVKWGYNSGKTYLGNPVDDPMSKIITQKYIGIFPDGGWEAWCDHRRLHLPILIPFAAPDATAVTATDGGPGNFTHRITYPSIESLNNKAFYDEAVGRQGPDKETTHVWWDK
jgi:SusD/RagB-like outer membrane lipoprotein